MKPKQKRHVIKNCIPIIFCITMNITVDYRKKCNKQLIQKHAH